MIRSIKNSYQSLSGWGGKVLICSLPGRHIIADGLGFFSQSNSRLLNQQVLEYSYSHVYNNSNSNSNSTFIALNLYLRDRL